MMTTNANDKDRSAQGGSGHCVFVVHKNSFVTVDVRAHNLKDECRRCLGRAGRIVRRRARRRRHGGSRGRVVAGSVVVAEREVRT